MNDVVVDYFMVSTTCSCVNCMCCTKVQLCRADSLQSLHRLERWTGMVEWNSGIANSAKMRSKVTIFGFQMMFITSLMVLSALIWLANAYLVTITTEKQYFYIANSGFYVYIYM